MINFQYAQDQVHILPLLTGLQSWLNELWIERKMMREWHLWVSQGPLIIVVADCEKLPNKPEDDTPDKSGYFVNYYCENGWA